MADVEVKAVFATQDDTVMLVLWHDKGRSISLLDNHGSFVPLDKPSAGALADLLDDLVQQDTKLRMRNVR